MNNAARQSYGAAGSGAMFFSAQSIAERSGKNFERFILLEVAMWRDAKTAYFEYETNARESAAIRSRGFDQLDGIAAVQY